MSPRRHGTSYTKRKNRCFTSSSASSPSRDPNRQAVPRITWLATRKTTRRTQPRNGSVISKRRAYRDRVPRDVTLSAGQHIYRVQHTERVTNYEPANALLTKHYRSPWARIPERQNQDSRLRAGFAIFDAEAILHGAEAQSRRRCAHERNGFLQFVIHHAL